MWGRGGYRDWEVGGRGRQIRCGVNTETRDEVSTDTKLLMPCFQEKPLSFRLQVIVPQTDTGGRVENTNPML